MKLLDVCAEVRKRNGDLVLEPKMDAKGRFVLEDGSSRLMGQIKETDELALEPTTLGKVINHALDMASDKLEPSERKKRFRLSIRVQEALDAGKMLEFDPEDRKRIEAASELITNNHLFLYRIEEALENALPVKSELKAVQ